MPNKPLKAVAREGKVKGSSSQFKPKQNFHLLYFSVTSIRAMLKQHRSTLELLNVTSRSQEVQVLVQRR